MPVEFDILDNGHIVRYVVTDPWHYDDYRPMSEKEIVHRDSVTHKVHNLTITRAQATASGVLQTRNAPTFTHRTSGHLAIVGVGSHVRLFGEMVAKLARFDRVKFFETEAQALEYLRGIIQAEDQSANK